ncbi:replication initiation protein [Sphingomonas sp.]|uniref:replication initiation protein n=1 Tax=Sphingomonas sp. TaxID=28214 RepID=UPI0025DFCA8C|nr:replication initiation protein [Sphingomonas sp.]MBV9527751.1 replication initiation protein [Sphingomonas sp.]
MSRTAAQKTNLSGFPKPGELIEMTGTHALEASDRSILNLLYQHAHDSGRLLDPTAEWEIPFVDLRQAITNHEGVDRLRASLERLMNVKVNVTYMADMGEGHEPEPRVVTSVMFDFFDLPKKNLTRRPTLKYGIARKLAPILESSARWGRIKAEVVCSMTSKYAIALHELIQLRANLDRCVEPFAIDRFRELLGVPPGKYGRFDNLMSKVIEPALLQVNGLSDMGVNLQAKRRHSRAPVHEVVLNWWPKEGDAFRDAARERNRPKVGRMARLRGQVEKVEAPGPRLPSPEDHAELSETLAKMRAAE